MKRYSKFVPITCCGLLVMAIVLFNSCSKTTSVTPNDTGLFPQTIGDFWEYAIFDSTRNFHDTALVTIAGTTTLPSGQSAYIWRFHYHNKGYSDSTYVVINGTTAIAYINIGTSSSPNYVEYQQFVSPVSLGQSINAAGDTLNVIKQQGLNTPAGNFYPAYEIIHHNYNAGYYTYERILFYNEVGILYFSHWAGNYNNFLENGQWTLLNFNVNTSKVNPSN